MGQIKRIRRTRITVSSTEKLIVWRVPQNDRAGEPLENLTLESPHCGEKVFWLEIEKKPDGEFYEETLNRE